MQPPINATRHSTVQQSSQSGENTHATPPSVRNGLKMAKGRTSQLAVAFCSPLKTLNSMINAITSGAALQMYQCEARLDRENAKPPMSSPEHQSPLVYSTTRAAQSKAEPKTKASAEPANAYGQTIKERWNDAARKTRKPPPAPTTLPPAEDHFAAPEAPATPMAPAKLFKPTTKLPVLRTIDPDMIKALSIAAEGVSSSAIAMQPPALETQTPAKPALQPVDPMQMKDYDDFVDANLEARREAEIGHADKYNFDSVEMQEIGEKFEDIATPVFNLACSEALENGLKESEALKFACRKSTETALAVFKESKDPAILSYAEFMEQHELVLADVIPEDYQVTKFTIEYKSRSQSAEAPVEVSEAPLQEAAIVEPVEQTVSEHVQEKPKSGNRPGKTMHAKKSSRGIGSYLGSSSQTSAKTLLKGLLGKSKSAKVSTPTSGVAEQDAVRVREHGVVHLDSSEVIQDSGQQAKGNVQLLSAWQIPTSKPEL